MALQQLENPDSGLGVEFFTKPVLNKRKSDEAKRPIYEDREFVRIAIPGDRKRETVAPAHEMHFDGNTRQQTTYAERFAGNYQLFKDGMEQRGNGTSLEALYELTGSERAELEGMKIFTVEQLASVSTQARRAMGAMANKVIPMAEEYMQAKAGNHNPEVEALKARIAELEAASTPVEPDPGTDDTKWADFSDDDLKNMIKDAGGEVPRGNAARGTLITRLEALIEAKESE